MKKLIVMLLVVILAGAGFVLYVGREWRVPGSPAEGGFVEIPQGLGARGIVQLLEEKKVIPDRFAALVYIFYRGNRNKLQAGEYQFDRSMTIPEILDKIASGAVYLHKFTIPEGLTLSGIAQRWEEQGFGNKAEFLQAAESGLDVVHRIDEKATSVEGYLFPETYSFPRKTNAPPKNE